MRKISRHILAFLALLFSIGSLFAYGEVIYDIRVEGTRNVASELVTTSINLKVGDTLDPDLLGKSIKTLYKMGVFSDIQVHSEAYRNGVNLIFKVVENPVLSAIEYSGMKAIRKDRLDELVKVRVGTFWSEYQKHNLQQAMMKEYRSKGFANAKITVEETPAEKNKIQLKVAVDEGKRVAIHKVTFAGNKNFEDKVLLKRMKTKPASLLRSGRFEQEKFDADLVSLAAFYRKNGYVDVRIGPWELNSIGERELELVINVQEGRKYLLGEITVEGNSNFTTEAILGKFTLDKGEPFNQEKFENQLRGVYSLYFDEGYIYTEIAPDIKKVDDKLNVSLKIVEGNRARIREIIITGNTRTKEKVIRRQLEIAPGDYYRQSQVISTQQNIYNLGFFEPDISLDYEQVNAEGDIDLKINVVDKSSGVANGGVGYNSEDKFVGSLSVSENNLFGNNWSSSLTWEFGGSTQNFEFGFTNPNFLDSDVLLGTNIYYTEKDWSSFYYKIFTRGASLRAGQFLPWVDRTRFVAGYSWYSKKYRITDMDNILENPTANATLIELDSLSWQYTSAVNATISRDTRDNIYFPTRGTQITLFTEAAGGILGGDFDYFKQIAQVNWYSEIWNKITLRAKWRFGYVTPYGNSKDVPPDEKFYLGGTGVDGIRGYADRSVGPEGGGTREIIFSTEVGYPIGGDQLIAVGFFDAGNSYNHLREFNFLDFKKGIGAGLRLRSPFGLIGFDYAYNLDEGGWEPHLQFGTTF